MNVAGTQHPISVGGTHRSACSDAEHDEAVLRAEVRRLVRALAPYGVLQREVLRLVVGASNWHEPSFERALDAAVEQGQIDALPLGFYGLHRAHRSRG